MIQLETRSIETELRASQQGIITGYAILFNTESQLLGGQFTEIIKPEACYPEFMQKQDIIMKYNHKDDSVLARYKSGSNKNTLRHSTDTRGVTFEFRVKKADEYLLEDIRNGDLQGCSFAFRVSPQGEKFLKRDNGKYLRTITAFENISDFSIVISPAYESTIQTLSARSLQMTKPNADLGAYYKKYEDKIKANERYSPDFRTKADAEIYHKKYTDMIEKIKKG